MNDVLMQRDDLVEAEGLGHGDSDGGKDPTPPLRISGLEHIENVHNSEVVKLNLVNAILTSDVLDRNCSSIKRKTPKLHTSKEQWSNTKCNLLIDPLSSPSAFLSRSR